MCTCTFLKDETGRFVLTTNRDELASRPTAAPAVQLIDGLKVLFPKDLLAGGSWVGFAENGIIACLMNGAEREQPWLGTTAKKSRGQVLLESFQFTEAAQFFKSQDFKEIHPFTLLHLNTQLQVLEAIKWNGQEKWMESFDIDQAHIWSSYTLYPEDQRKERAAMFNDWRKDKSHLNADAVLKLHRSTKAENGLRLTDSKAVNTVSITQLILNPEQGEMKYELMSNAEKSVAKLDLR